MTWLHEGWAAGQFGSETDAYAKSVVMADFEEAGDEDRLRKVRKDLGAAGKSVSDGELCRTMNELLARAVEEVRTRMDTARTQARTPTLAPDRPFFTMKDWLKAKETA